MNTTKNLSFPEEAISDLLRRLNDLALMNIKSATISDEIQHGYLPANKSYGYRMEPYPHRLSKPQPQMEQNETTTTLCVCNLSPDTTLQDVETIFKGFEVALTLNVCGILVAKVNCPTEQDAVDIVLKQNGIIIRGRPMRLYLPCKKNPASAEPRLRKRGGIPLTRFKGFREKKLK